MIKFITKKHIEKKPSTLLYREEEYSFDTEPLHDTGGSSIMINDLQLEIDHEGGVLYVWGLCPLIEYQETG